MAMTCNADAGISSPDAFHPEGLYAVRFDTNGDAREEVAFKFRFGQPKHAERRRAPPRAVCRRDSSGWLRDTWNSGNAAR